MISPNFITRFLILLLAFATPLIFLTWTSELFEFNKMIFVYFVTGLILLTLKPLSTIHLPHKLITVTFIVFLLILGFSTIFSIHPYTSIWGYYSRFQGGLLSYTIFILLAFITHHQIQSRPRLQTLIINAFLISICLVSIYGILQHFGIDDHVWKQDVLNRVFSTLGQPNWLALALIAGLPITWSLLINPKYRQTRYLYLISFLTQSLLTICLIYTKSRSGLIATTIMAIIFWFLVFIRSTNLKQNIKAFTVFGIALLSSYLIATNQNLDNLFLADSKIDSPITTNITSGGTNSFEIRKIVWEGAYQLGISNLLLGTGPETFAYSYFWTRPNSHNYISEWDFIYNKAHNEFLNFFATTGILGVMSYTGLLISIIFIVSKIILTNPNNIHAITGLSIIIGLSIGHSAGFSVVVSNFALFILPITIIATNYNTTLNINPIWSKLIYLIQIFSGLTLIIFSYKIFIADTRYATAQQLYKNSYITESATLITEAIKYYPYELNYHNLASKIYADIALEFAKNGNSDNAFNNYDLAISYSNHVYIQNPYNTIFLTDRASVLSKLTPFDLNNLNLAIESLQLQTKLAPTDPRPRYNLAILESRNHNLNLTFDYLNEALKLKSNYHEAIIALALYHYQQSLDENQKVININELKQAIQLIKDNPTTFPLTQWNDYLIKWQKQLNEATN